MNSLMNLCRPVLKGMVIVDESKLFVKIDFFLSVVRDHLTLIDLSNTQNCLDKQKKTNKKKTGKIHVNLLNTSFCQCKPGIITLRCCKQVLQ